MLSPFSFDEVSSNGHGGKVTNRLLSPFSFEVSSNGHGGKVTKRHEGVIAIRPFPFEASSRRLSDSERSGRRGG